MCLLTLKLIFLEEKIPMFIQSIFLRLDLFHSKRLRLPITLHQFKKISLELLQQVLWVKLNLMTLRGMVRFIEISWIIKTSFKKAFFDRKIVAFFWSENCSISCLKIMENLIECFLKACIYDQKIIFEKKYGNFL